MSARDYDPSSLVVTLGGVPFPGVVHLPFKPKGGLLYAVFVAREAATHAPAPDSFGGSEALGPRSCIAGNSDDFSDR